MRNLVYDVRRYYHAVAPFLEAELAGRGDEHFWRQIAQEHASGSILELGCGTGRVTELLAASGARVVGIDVCPELLQLVSCRLAGKDAWLVLADMRQLAFSAKFDAIVAPDDPFSHLLTGTDRDSALACIARLLAPGGRLILDALWFRPEDESRTTGPGLSVDRNIVSRGGHMHVTERWQCNPRSHCCSTHFDYDDGSHSPTSAHFRARYWTMAELRRRFSAAGLRITACWGDYDRRTWDEDRSTALVVEAKPDSALAR